MIDEFVKRQIFKSFVIPVEAGIQLSQHQLDPGWSLPRTAIRAGVTGDATFYEGSKLQGISLRADLNIHAIDK